MLQFLALPVAWAGLYSATINSTPRPMIHFVKDYFGDYPLNAAEIGTYRGINADNMLKYLNINEIYLIDPYQSYNEYTDPINDSIDDKTFNEAKWRTSHSADKITWIREPSNTAYNKIPDKLDYIYIDGNHLYNYVIEDIDLYYPKVRSGGVIGGHDVFLSDVIDAVEDSFDEYYCVFPDWWIIKP